MADFLNFVGEFECYVKINEWKISSNFCSKLSLGYFLSMQIFNSKKKIWYFRNIPKELSTPELWREPERFLKIPGIVRFFVDFVWIPQLYKLLLLLNEIILCYMRWPQLISLNHWGSNFVVKVNQLCIGKFINFWAPSTQFYAFYMKILTSCDKNWFSLSDFQIYFQALMTAV